MITLLQFRDPERLSNKGGLSGLSILPGKGNEIDFVFGLGEGGNRTEGIKWGERDRGKEYRERQLELNGIWA